MFLVQLNVKLSSPSYIIWKQIVEHRVMQSLVKKRRSNENLFIGGNDEPKVKL